MTAPILVSHGDLSDLSVEGTEPGIFLTSTLSQLFDFSVANLSTTFAEARRGGNFEDDDLADEELEEEDLFEDDDEDLEEEDDLYEDDDELFEEDDDLFEDDDFDG